MSSSKTCSKCKEAKPLSDFYRDKSKRDGYRHDCKACNDLRCVAYRQTNRERVRTTKRAYADSHKEHRAELMRTWQKANAERVREHGRAWNERNPGQSAERSRRRRARLNNNKVYAVSASYLKRLYASPCVYCGSHELIEADHVIPVSRGGNHSIGNLVPACRTCNRSKGDQTITEWKRVA